MHDTIDYSLLTNWNESDMWNETEGWNGSLSNYYFDDDNFRTTIERAFDLQLYLPPVIFLIGIVGNTLATVISFRRQNRALSPHVFMGAVAVIDNVVLLLLLSTDWVFFSILKDQNSQGLCKAFLFMDGFLTDLSCWIIVAMTTDRFIAVRFPLKAHAHCNPERAWKVIQMIAAGTLIKNIHLLWNATLKYDANSMTKICVYHSDNKSFMFVYPWIDICFSSIIPATIILIENSLIVSNYRKSSAFRNALIESSTKMVQLTAANEQTAIRAAARQRKPVRSAVAAKQRQLTYMLLLVSIVFVILTLPRKIHLIVYYVKQQANGGIKPDQFATYLLSFVIAEKLWYLNNGVHFYVYCLFGGKYRRDLTDVYKNLVARFTTDKAAKRRRLMSSVHRASIMDVTNIDVYQTLMRRSFSRKQSLIIYRHPSQKLDKNKETGNRHSSSDAELRQSDSNLSLSRCSSERSSRPSLMRYYGADQARPRTSKASIRRLERISQWALRDIPLVVPIAVMDSSEFNISENSFAYTEDDLHKLPDLIEERSSMCISECSVTPRQPSRHSHLLTVPVASQLNTGFRRDSACSSCNSCDTLDSSVIWTRNESPRLSSTIDIPNGYAKTPGRCSPLTPEKRLKLLQVSTRV